MKKITLLFFMLFVTLFSYSQLAEEGFEATWQTFNGTSGVGGPTGWAIINGGATGSTVWWVQANGGSTQPPFTGLHAAFLDKENVAINTTSEDWLITKAFALPVNPQLHFYSKLFFNADQLTQFKVYISSVTGSVAAQTTTANYGTPVLQWTELQLNPVQTAWTEKTVDIPTTITPGTQVYLAFVMLGDNAERWDIDDVSVTSKCLDPSALTAGGITMTTANLSWANPSGATQWEVEVLPQTGTPTGTGVNYTGALPFVAGAPGSGITLTANTDYKYYVRAHCSDGGKSNWVGPFNFSTVALGESCEAPIIISALPFATTDNTGNYADNYEGSPGATGCGDFGSLDGNDVVYTYTAPFTGIISVDVTNNGPLTGMFIYNSCASIGVSCIGGGVSDFNPTPISVPTLSVTANTTYYIVISSQEFPQTVPYTLTIQQVNCLKPVGLPPTNIGMASADLSWTNPSNATSWQIYVQSPAGGIPSGAGTTVTANTNLTVTTTATGASLVTASPYEYYVRADCGNGTFSAWAGPYLFNTMICEPAAQCTYTFVLTDSFGDGWNGATMTVSQNGIAIATLGADFTDGNGPITVPVQVCNNTPLQLFWTAGGNFPNEVGISVQNNFAQTIFTKQPGTGSPNTSLFTGPVNCDTPLCLPPTQLTVTNTTQTTATLTWAGPATGLWEYYIVEAGTAAPTAATAPTGATTTNPVIVSPAQGLEEATNYEYYVRMVCEGGDLSEWAGPSAFSTDVCPESEQCNYTFVMTSNFGIGYAGATMVISQNGTNAAIIGPGFNDGTSQSVTVPLCTNTPFQVNWVEGGDLSFQVGLQIVNSFSQTLFTQLPGDGTPGTVIYSSTADCLVPACLPPTGLAATNNTMTTVDLSWDGPATGSWEYYIVNADANETAPTDASTPTGATTTNPVVGVTLPLAATNYQYYVRIVCSEDTESAWAGPFNFNTTVCAPEDQCNYVFSLTDSFGDGWNGGIMTVFQAGVPVGTLGANFTFGTGPINVEIPMCPGEDFELVWSNAGNFPVEMGITVLTPFGEDIFTKPSGTGTPGTTLYSESASCTPPTCFKPQELGVFDIVLNGAQLSWTEAGSATQWEVTVVAFQADGPNSGDPVVTANITSDNPYTVNNLQPGTTYSFYVRALCGEEDGNSLWSGPFTFTTALLNDDCAGATNVPVNPGADCTDFVTGTITGSTGSGVVPSCNSFSDINFDAWYSFVATQTSHAVNLNNQVGAFLNFTVYEGNNCGELTEIACTFNNFTVLQGLTPGNTYYVMVYTTFFNNPTDVTSYEVCVTTPEPPITTSTTQYTVEELVTDVFIGSECAIVTNITSSTGTDFGLNGIGSFDQNGSSFPFDSGVVLVSSAVSSVPGPNDNTINGDFEWDGDTELEDIVGLAPGNSHDASWIQFDFSPLIDMPLSFDFIFASEEYGVPSFECFFSDAFAFILTDLEGDQPVENLAVLPGTNIPILVTNVHPFNDQCGAANPTLFDHYNGPLSPINLNGQLVPITATSSYTLIANHQYRMKMVIANKGDHSLSSAVFLLAGSFDLGDVPLGDDMTVTNGNAVCNQGSVVLESNLDPALHTFTWLLDGVVIAGQTGPNLTVTEPGVYTLEAPVNNSTCIRTGEIAIEFYPAVEVIVANPTELAVCDPDGFATFDLTQNTATILAGLDASLYTVTYYLTQADALAPGNAIATPTAFTNTTQFTQTIWTRIVINSSQCVGVKSFNLTIEDLTPQFTIEDDFVVCEGGSDTIDLTPINFDPANVTFSWTLDGTDLGLSTPSITATAQGVYAATVNYGGCTTTKTVTVTVVPMPVADDPADVTACDSYTLPALSAGNAYYTETNGGGVQLFADEVITSPQDIYVFASNAAAGCTAENVFTVTIAPSPVIVAAEVTNIVTCDTYTLPALTVGSYYTAADGAGTLIPAGTVYNTAGVETVYVYAQTGTTPNCTASASFTVTITTTPVADDPADVAVCDSYTLPALSAGNVYYSGPGATGNVVPAGTVIIDNTTLYIVAQAAGNASCTSENPFAIVIVPSPEVSLTQGCNDNDEYELAVVFEDELYNSDNATFAWSGPENGTGAALVITTPGTYVVTVTPINSAVCPVEATIVVDETSCKVQKGISPNNDGMNDSFDLSGLDVRKLEIFNRYGKEVYSKSGYRNEWFGQTDGGDELPTGTYFYMFERNNGEAQTGWIYVNRQDK